MTSLQNTHALPECWPAFELLKKVFRSYGHGARKLEFTLDSKLGKSANV